MLHSSLPHPYQWWRETLGQGMKQSPWITCTSASTNTSSTTISTSFKIYHCITTLTPPTATTSTAIATRLLVPTGAALSRPLQNLRSTRVVPESRQIHWVNTSLRMNTSTSTSTNTNTNTLAQAHMSVNGNHVKLAGLRPATRSQHTSQPSTLALGRRATNVSGRAVRGVGSAGSRVSRRYADICRLVLSCLHPLLPHPES